MQRSLEAKDRIGAFSIVHAAVCAAIKPSVAFLLRIIFLRMALTKRGISKGLIESRELKLPRCDVAREQSSETIIELRTYLLSVTSVRSRELVLTDGWEENSSGQDISESHRTCV